MKKKKKDGSSSYQIKLFTNFALKSDERRVLIGDGLSLNAQAVQENYSSFESAFVWLATKQRINFFLPFGTWIPTNSTSLQDVS